MGVDTCYPSVDGLRSCDRVCDKDLIANDAGLITSGVEDLPVDRVLFEGERKRHKWSTALGEWNESQMTDSSGHQKRTNKTVIYALEEECECACGPQ